MRKSAYLLLTSLLFACEGFVKRSSPLYINLRFNHDVSIDKVVNVFQLSAQDDKVGVNEIDDSVFGAEFSNSFAPTKKESEIYGYQTWQGKTYKKVKPDRLSNRGEVMRDFDKARATFLKDNVFVVLLGLSATWGLGTLIDVKSYGLGAVLGLMYALLLGRYVEQLGTDGSTGGGGGGARFAPVILLIALYGKFKTQFHLVPELLGFFSYQVASFLQAFNQDLYDDNSYNGDGDSDDDEEDDDE